MTVTITDAPSPNRTNHERFYLVRASSIGKPMALDAALRRGRSGLAIDTPSRRRARDSVLSEHDDPHVQLEQLLSEHLQGEPFEKCQRLLDRIVEARETERQDDDMIDDAEADEPEEEQRFFGGRNDEEERARRKMRMSQLADHLLTAREDGGQGFDEEAVRSVLSDFPKNGLESLRSEQIAEDLESVMQKHLEQMGGGATNVYRDMPQSKDRRRQQAHDERRERRERRDFLRRYPEAARLEGRPGDMCNFGDRETLAYDEQQSSAADDARFNEWFPGAARIRCE